MHRATAFGTTLALLSALILSGCAASPDAPSPGSSDAGDWLDDTVPRAALDGQGQLNRVGLAITTLRALDVPEDALTNDESEQALVAICDSLDEGSANDVAIIDMVATVPASVPYGAEFLAAAAHRLCPEHAETVMANN